jgi:hypothetical protein
MRLLCEQVMFGLRVGWQFVPPGSEQLGASSTWRGAMSYDPPLLAKPHSYSLEPQALPKHHGPDLSLILSIAALIIVVGFFVAVFVGAATAGGA